MKEKKMSKNKLKEKLIEELKMNFDYYEYESKLRGEMLEFEGVDLKELMKTLEPYLKDELE